MQTSTHGNGNGLDNLYILPDTNEEQQVIENWLRARSVGFRKVWSTVPADIWTRKEFLDVPFREDCEVPLRQYLAAQAK
jgi:hypothetical protein